MSDTLTNTRIYAKDKAILIERFGGPAHEAIRKAVTENCPHPEERRSYLTAELPIPTQESNERKTLGGFYCLDCNRFIFKAPLKK